MKRDYWLVNEDDITPNGKPDECFWCKAKLGSQHKSGCVRRDRTVVVEAKFTLIMRFPESWDESKINFKLNQSSTCANNFFNELADLKKRIDKLGGCLCGMFEGQYVREADESDEDFYLNRIQDNHPVTSDEDIEIVDEKG